MSNEALTWAFKQDLKTGAKFVLVALADYADENYSCYPSFDQIGDKTGMKNRAVSTHISYLTNEQFISKKRTRNSAGNLGRYRYKLHLHNLPLGEIPTCKKRQSLPAKSAGHNPQLNPQVKDIGKPISKKPRAKPMKFLSDDWRPSPNPNTQTYTRQAKLSHDELEREIEKFKNHYTAKQIKSADFGRQWSTWLINAEQWKSERGNKQSSTERIASIGERRRQIRAGVIAASQSNGLGG